MITRNFEITIRIPEQNYIPTLFQVVENDNDVYNLTIHITDGINEIDYSQVSSATITFSKADGNVVQGDMTVGADALTYTMGTNEISYPGPVIASVQLFGAVGERLTTARFKFTVIKDLITPSAVKSTSEFPLLQRLEKSVETVLPLIPVIEEAIDKVPEMLEAEEERVTAEAARVAAEAERQTQEAARQASIADIEQRFTQLTTSQQQDAEVIEARMGFASLRQKLENVDSAMAKKANQADLTALETRVDTIITTPVDGVSAQEIIDARQGAATLGANIEAFKNEYATYKDSNSLKVAKIEKDLNDYQQAMAGVNVNQEPTQQATGYGIITLPKNAANGQVSARLLGRTLSNLFGTQNVQNNLLNHNSGSDIGISTNGGIGHGSSNRKIVKLIAGNVYFIKTNWLAGTNNNINMLRAYGGSIIADFTQLGGSAIINGLSTYLKFTAPSTDEVGLLWRNNVADSSYYHKETMLYNLTELGLADKTIDELNQILGYVSNTKSTVGAMRLKSVSADETETSTAYVVAKDEEGNIAEFRSLPNGTKDEINVTDRKLIKRIGEKSNITNGMVIDFADMAEGGTYYAWNEDGETETGTKGDTLGINATQLIYQLATPIEIPIQTSGSLVSYPSGTVYIEPYVADAGIYTDKMEVLYSDLPIKALEKISKVDFDTGLETELDITAAVIAEDKLSFTHPDLVDGDIVFFTYEYDRESTEGETEIEYYDSRYVIKDSVTGKFYKWHIAVADGVPSIELTEV